MPAPGPARRDADPVTQIGGEGRVFPSTSWTLLQSAEAGDGAERRRCLDRLVALYWKPVYWFIRSQWKKHNEEAKDLTQEFFAMFLEKDWLRAYDADRARFRTYLRAALSHFLCAAKRDANRLKRGGGLRALPLDMARECDLEPAADDLRPEEAFDRAWAETLLQGAISSLEETYRSSGRESYFQVFELIDLSKGPAPTYEEAAARLEIPVDAVHNRLKHVRRAFRDILRGRVLETLSNPADLDSEIAWLLGGR